MNQSEVQQMLEKTGALMSGHFKLSSGRHSDTYVQKQRVFEHPRLTSSLAESLVGRFQTERFSVVVAPAVGAIAFGFAVAHAANVRFLFTERVEGHMQLRRGQTLLRGDRVLVVEDVITTGGSAQEVIEAVQALGGHVIGVGALVDRSNVTPRYRLEPLLRVSARDYSEAECPMCREGDAIDSPGSRFSG